MFRHDASDKDRPDRPDRLEIRPEKGRRQRASKGWAWMDMDRLARGQYQLGNIDCSILMRGWSGRRLPTRQFKDGGIEP